MNNGNIWIGVREIEGNQDVPELVHNWSLRLDRITAAVMPVEGQWQSSLEQLEVEMHIFGRLAFAYYQPKLKILSMNVSGQEGVRRVVKRISSILVYAEVLKNAPIL